MSLNDTSTGIGDTKGVDIPAGVANPTPASVYGNPKKDNYVEDPPEQDTSAKSTGLGDTDTTIADTKIEPIGTASGQTSSIGASLSSGTSSEPGIVEQVTEAAKSALNSLTGAK